MSPEQITRIFTRVRVGDSINPEDISESEIEAEPVGRGYIQPKSVLHHCRNRSTLPTQKKS